MYAFYKDTDNDQALIKFYDQGDDWQVISGDVERWFSTWSHGLNKEKAKHDSLVNACQHACHALNIQYNKDNLVVVFSMEKY